MKNNTIYTLGYMSEYEIWEFLKGNPSEKDVLDTFGFPDSVWLDELESTRRKVYAGGIGYFSANGEFDTCIALRTAVAKNKKFYVQAGAGIVADSKPIKEYDETVNKAKALINALR